MDFLAFTRSLMRTRLPQRYSVATEWEWELTPITPPVLSVWKRTNRLDPPYRYTATPEETELLRWILFTSGQNVRCPSTKNGCNRP